MIEILTNIESLSLYNYHSVFMVSFVMIDHKIILLVGVTVKINDTTISPVAAWYIW